MGSKDSATKKCLKNKERFADLINAIVFNGAKTVNSATLQELDSTEVVLLPTSSNKMINVQKYRDIIKEALIMYDDKNEYILLGIENQNAIHYAMPVRNMLYNAMTYENQINQLLNVQKTFNSKSEFLSGLPKGTKLKPVITITLYWGSEPWDGPITLKEMFEPYPKEAEPYIDDININLVELAGNDIYEKCNTDLRQLLLAVSASNDKERFKLLAKDVNFSNVSLEVANAISECTDIKRPRNKTKGGGYNMCKAVQELEKEYTNIGADNAILKNIKTLMAKTRQTFEDVCEMLDISKTDMLRYKNMM